MTKKTFKQIIIGLSILVFVLVLFYLAFSFYWLDINAANWDYGARAGFLVFGGLISIFTSVGIVMSINEPNNKNND